MRFDAGLIVSFATRDLVYFSIAMCVLVLNYWAMTRIIRQAGYSTYWIVIPLAPLAITVAYMVIAYHDLNALVQGVPIGFFGANGLTVLWHLDELSGLILWLFFLIFAFSKWPVAKGRAGAKDTTQRPAPAVATANRASTDRPTTTRSSAVSRPEVPNSPPEPSPDSAAGRGAPTLATAPGPRKAVYCGWCGEAIPGNRGLSHDCGPKDRPFTCCRFCGKPLADGAERCTECFP